MKLIFIFIVSISIAACRSNSSRTKTIENETASEITIDGEALLKANCNSCHKCFEDITGPGLHGSFNRWDTKENLIAFVQNSEPVLKTNEYAAELKKKYGVNYIHRFNNLDSNQIKVMIYYCDFYKP